jgi:hypothetical protein
VSVPEPVSPTRWRLRSGGDALNACSTLDAFINEVRAQTGKRINEAVADDLVARAKRIKTLLGC